jgi:hypothetical protein
MRQLDVDVFAGELGFREESALSFGHRRAASQPSCQGPPDVMECRQGKTSRFEISVVRAASSAFDLRRCA